MTLVAFCFKGVKLLLRKKRGCPFEKPKVGGEEPRVHTASVLWDPQLRSRPGCQQIQTAGVSGKTCLQGHSHLSGPLKVSLFLSRAECLQLSWVPPLDAGLHGCAVGALPSWSGVLALRAWGGRAPEVGSVHPSGEGPHHPASPMPQQGWGTTHLAELSSRLLWEGKGSCLLSHMATDP